MDIEILSKLLELSNNDGEVIREYLDENTQSKLKSFELYDPIQNDLYISMKIIIISKSTLEIIHEGVLISIHDTFLRIQIKYKYNISISKELGYIFMKSKNKTQKEYYKCLLDSLS
jgi:hypothetical protein